MQGESQSPRFVRVTQASIEIDNEEPIVGRRDQRIRMLRKQLIRTGLDLFCKKGFGDVTVTEIANIVGVSSRTFFRHFAVKEDIVFPTEAHRHMDKLLHSTSPHVPVTEALRDTLLSIGRLHDARPLETRRILQMIYGTPPLTGRLHYELTRLQKSCDDFTRERMPDLTQQGAFLLSVQNAAMIAAYHSAVRHWAMECKKGAFSPWFIAALGTLPDLADGGGTLTSPCPPKSAATS